MAWCEATVASWRNPPPTTDPGRTAHCHRPAHALASPQDGGSGVRLSRTGPGLHPNSPLRGSQHVPGDPHDRHQRERRDPLQSWQGPVQKENMGPLTEESLQIPGQQQNIPPSAESS